MGKTSTILGALLFCIPIQGAIDADSVQKSISFSGFGSFEFGQMVKGTYNRIDYDHYWQQLIMANISVTATINERLMVKIGLETQGKHSFEHSNTFPTTTLTMVHQTYIDQADAEYALMQQPEASLSLKVGYFPYKYNPEVRNLGEYLLTRGGTYPQFLINNFDFAQSRLLGIGLHSSLWNIFDNDLLLSSTIFPNPTQDYSISLISSLKPIPAVTVGGGISFDRLLSVNSLLTTPQKGPYVENGDTTYYSFAGTKLMSRFCFDPKCLFDLKSMDLDWFGEQDFKLYGEFDILGLKNYPVYYDSILQRIPIVLGFNIPTFKILEVAAFEFEWFGGKYPNSLEEIINGQNKPVPKKPSDFGPYTKDDFKWSFYVKGDIIPGLSIIGQIACDHSRAWTALESTQDYEEVYRYPTNWDRAEWYWLSDKWYWVIKTKYAF